MFAPLLATAVASSTAMAAPPAVAAPVEEERASSRLPILGLGLDAGLPSGAGASVLVRPLSWLRLHGGVATNGAGIGIRGGLSFAPLRSFVTPTLTVEGGHFFEGDASGFARDVVQLPSYGDEMLERVYYDYGAAHLGLEFGSQSGFVFYLRGGVAYVWSELHGVQAALDDRDDGVRFEADDPKLTLVIPSAQIGVAYYFF